MCFRHFLLLCFLLSTVAGQAVVEHRQEDHHEDEDDHDHDHENEHHHEDHYFESLLNETRSSLSDKMSLPALSLLLSQLNEECLQAESIFRKFQLNDTDGLSEEQFLNTSSVIALYLRGNHSLSCHDVTDNLFDTAQTELFGTGQVCRGNMFTLIDSIRDEGAPQANESATNCFSAAQLLESCSTDSETVNEAVTGMLLYLYQRRCILPEPSFFINDLFEYLNSTGGNIASSTSFQNLLRTFNVGGESDSHDDHDHDDHGHDNHDHDEHGHEEDEHNHARKRRSSHDHDHDHDDDHDHANETKCYSANELLAIAGNEQDSSDNLILSESGLVQICPAILQQVVRGACRHEETTTPTSDPSSYTTAQKYGYGTASVLAISLLAFCGLLLFPSIGSNAYKMTMQFFVALGVGTLSGDALLHIIPEVVGLHNHAPGDGHDHGEEEEDQSYIYKLLVVIAGIYLFYFFENSLRLFNHMRGKNISLHQHHHNNQHGHSNAPIANPYALDSIADDVEADVSKEGKKIPESDANSDSSEAKSICCGITPLGLMILIGDIFHNLGDGLALGVAFSSSPTAGLATSIAIFCHELPHEFGDFALYLNNGLSKVQALLFNFMAACWAFIGLYIGLSVSENTEARQWMLALVAGMFLYIALVDILHELTQQISPDHPLTFFFLQNLGLLLGWVILLLLALYEEKIGESLG